MDQGGEKKREGPAGCIRERPEFIEKNAACLA